MIAVRVTGFEPVTPCPQNRCATKLRHTRILARAAGLEPATFWLTVRCSTYWTTREWYGTPSATWTRNLRLRGSLLYPIELRACYGGVDRIRTCARISTPSALAKHPLKPDLSTTPYWHVRYDSNIHLMVLETTALPIKLRTRKRETKRTF